MQLHGLESGSLRDATDEKVVCTPCRSHDSSIVRLGPIVRQSDGIAGMQTIQFVLLTGH